MSSLTITRTRRLLPAFLVAIALAVAGCGGSSSKSSSTSTTSAPAAASSASGSNGIPQGPSAGDKDADNTGGPSDGDGNI